MSGMRIMAKVDELEGTLNGIWKCPYCGDVTPLIGDIIGVETCGCIYGENRNHPEHKIKIYIRKSQIYKTNEGGADGKELKDGVNPGSKRISQ